MGDDDSSSCEDLDEPAERSECEELGGSSRTLPEEESNFGQLAAGLHVRLAGLVSRPDLNGQVGVLQEFDTQAGRWPVQLGAKLGGAKLFKQENLQSILRPGAMVSFVRLVGAAHLNGQMGVCEKYDPISERWRVRPEGEKGEHIQPALFKAENLAPPRTLKPGSCVCVRRIEGQGGGQEHSSSLNFQTGVCAEHDPISHRWSVVLDSGRKLMFKASNLQLQPPVLKPGVYVLTQGLARTAMNGKIGLLQELDEHSCRWMVEFASGEVKCLQPANLVPQDGFDESDPRYKCDLSSTLGGAEGIIKVTNTLPREEEFCKGLQDALASGEIEWLDY